MTRPLSRRRSSHDEDPTGVQRLLATLPDPGPMPPQLVERISASLAAEREHRPLPDEGADVRPLLASRRGAAPSPSSAASSSAASGDPSRASAGRSSRGWLLGLSGVAAAAAVGGVVVINALGPTGSAADPVAQAQFHFGANGSDAVTAPASPTTDFASPSASPSASGSPAAPAQTATPGSAAGALSAAQVHVQLSSTQYSHAHLSDQAAALWSSPQPPLRALSAESTAIGPIGTPLGVSQCLTALGVSDVSRAVVDLAVYDGAPAAVVVTDGADGRDVRVVSRQCGAASTSVLAGPLTLR